MNSYSNVCEYDSPYQYESPLLHWCFHCPSPTNWVTTNVQTSTFFPPPPHPFQWPFYPTPPPTPSPHFSPPVLDQSLLQDMPCDSILFAEMIDEETNMPIAVLVHIKSDMTADLLFDDMPHCLSKVFAVPQTEQKPDKLESEHSTAAIFSTESPDTLDAIIISSKLNSGLDENKIEEAAFKTANLDSQPLVIVTTDTKSEIEGRKATPIASAWTDPMIYGVSFSRYEEILNNSGASRYSIISNNVAVQLVLLHFPFDPGSAGGLVFYNVALVLDNSFQLILPCIAPISPNEFGEHPMVLIAGQMFDTMSQPCVHIITPVVASEWENGNSRPANKICVESFQRIDTSSPWGGIETVKKCTTIAAATTESVVEDGNSKLVDQVFETNFLLVYQTCDEQTNARSLFTVVLRLYHTFDVHICCWVDLGQLLQPRLGVKIAKTLVLAGIMSVILLLPDKGNVDLWDWSSYFIFLELLLDYEAEVPTTAAGEITVFSLILSPPCVEELPSDSSQHALSVKALVMMGLTLISRKNTMVEHLLQIFLSLLMDESSQDRLNIIGNLEHMNKVLRIDLLSRSLLLVLVELTEDRHWMVQFAIIEFIPLLASQLGVGLCNDRLSALLYVIPVHYLVGLTYFTPKDFILMSWIVAHYPSLFKYPFAYIFINESEGEKGHLQRREELNVILWKATAHRWLLVLGEFDWSSNSLLPPDMLLFLYLVFPGKLKVPPDIMFGSLVVQLDDSVHVIFFLTNYIMILNEAVSLLGLVKLPGSSSIHRFICNLCFAGLFFEQYSIIGQVNFGASLAMFSQVAHDATNVNKRPLRMLVTVLKSLRHWINKELFHYHDNLSESSVKSCGYYSFPLIRNDEISRRRYAGCF